MIKWTKKRLWQEIKDAVFCITFIVLVGLFFYGAFALDHYLTNGGN